MNFRLLTLFFIGSSTLSSVVAQNSKDSLALIRTNAFDSISKITFSRMISGSEEQSNLSNYVSFKPSEGKFTLTGNYFWNTERDTSRKRKKEYFGIGFYSNGSIVGGTVATLFEGGSLNSGMNFGIKLSWRMNCPNVGTIGTETHEMFDKRKALEIERDSKIDSFKNSIELVSIKLKQIELNITDAKNKINKSKENVSRFTDSITKCNQDTCRLKFTDSLIFEKNKILSEEQRIKQLIQDTVKLSEIIEVSKIDKTKKWENRTDRERQLSSKYGLMPINVSYEDAVVEKLNKFYADKIYKVEIERPIQGLRMNWLSFILDWSRQDYRTYYDSLPFDAALTKVKNTGLTIGLQTNFYTIIRPLGQARLFNIAVLFKKTNNIEDLTSSKLNIEKSIINGSTTRKVNSEYTVYTDPIETFNTIQVPINYYRFFGKNLVFGWHAFGQADWRNTKVSLYDIGAGFIFGLNREGDKRLFNIEIFTKYKDITREIVDDNEKGWKQFQFGVSVAIPFMIYKN